MKLSLFFILSSICINVYGQNWIGYGFGDGYLTIRDGKIKYKLAEFGEGELIIKDRILDTLYCHAIDQYTGEYKYDQKLLIYGNIDSIKIPIRRAKYSTTYIDSSHVERKFTERYGKSEFSTQFRFHEFQLEILSPYGGLIEEINLSNNGYLVKRDARTDSIEIKKLTKEQFSEILSEINYVDIKGFQNSYGPRNICNNNEYRLTFVGKDLRKYSYVSMEIPWIIKPFIEKILRQTN